MTTLQPQQEGPVAAWTVRLGPEDEAEPDLGPCFEVLVPSGEWRGCIAVDANDARQCVREIWDEEQKQLASFYAPAVQPTVPKAGTIPVPNSKWSDREPLYDAAIAAYAAAIPSTYRYSAIGIVKAVDAALLALVKP